MRWCSQRIPVYRDLQVDQRMKGAALQAPAVSEAKKVSTTLAQEHEVGVKSSSATASDHSHRDGSRGMTSAAQKARSAPPLTCLRREATGQLH
jgi:hypothetical protein